MLKCTSKKSVYIRENFYDSNCSGPILFQNICLVFIKNQFQLIGGANVRSQFLMNYVVERSAMKKCNLTSLENLNPVICFYLLIE
jgi:hypothetical protein